MYFFLVPGLAGCHLSSEAGEDTEDSGHQHWEQLILASTGGQAQTAIRCYLPTFELHLEYIPLDA